MCLKFAKDKTSLAQPFGWRIGASGPWPGTLEEFSLGTDWCWVSAGYLGAMPGSNGIITWVSSPELRELGEKMTGIDCIHIPEMGGYPDGWFVMENPNKIRQNIDDLGLLPFWETSINMHQKNSSSAPVGAVAWDGRTDMGWLQGFFTEDLEIRKLDGGHYPKISPKNCQKDLVIYLIVIES